MSMNGMGGNMRKSLDSLWAAGTLAGLAFAWAAFLPGTASAQDRDLDRIVLTSGRSISATVLKDDFDKVVYKKVGRKEKEVPASTVMRITYGGLPDSFQQAVKMERKADEGAEDAQSLYENAAGSFELAANTIQRKPLKAFALYRTAICRMKLGLSSSARLPQAIEAFRKFLEFAPRSRFSLRARLQLARCYRLAGDLQNGVKVLDDFSKLILKETLPARWDAMVQVEKIRTLLAAGKALDASTLVNGAAKALEEIQKKDPEILALTMELKFLQGKCKIEAKDFSGAESYFQDLLSQSGKDPALKVVALAGLGETYYARGIEKKIDKDLWRAYLDFARAYVLDTEDKEMSARVLYYQGACLLALGPIKTGRNLAGTAKSYFEQIIKFFPLSDFAALAAKKIRQ